MPGHDHAGIQPQVRLAEAGQACRQARAPKCPCLQRHQPWPRAAICSRPLQELSRSSPASTSVAPGRASHKYRGYACWMMMPCVGASLNSVQADPASQIGALQHSIHWHPDKCSICSNSLCMCSCRQLSNRAPRVQRERTCLSKAARARSTNASASPAVQAATDAP